MTEETNVEALIENATSPETVPEAVTEGQPIDAQAEAEVSEEPSGQASRLIKHKGEEIGLDDERYVQYAQKGYDYEKKMHDFRVQQKLFQKEQEQFKSKFEELQQINEYAKANPKFEQLIQQQWALIQQGQSPAMEPQDEVQLLRAQMNQMQEKLNSQNEQAEVRRVAEMEARQEGAIDQFKAAHPYLDWATKDEHGQTLEDRIGEKMIESKVKDFDVMAKAMLMDKIIAHKAMESKETAAKDIQKANKLGLGKVTKKSQLASKPAEDVGKKSYDDLIREGLAEYGIQY